MENKISHDLFDDVIAQISPKGKGAVSALRLSGRNVKFYTEDLFNLKLNKVRYSYFVKTSIDDLIVVYYKGPKSYTGEDVVEIFCHGNDLIVTGIINKFINTYKVRVASRGEFTKRAYLNSKMDLIQAESVVDIINSTNLGISKARLNLLRGNLSNYFRNLKECLINFGVEGEMEIEFEEDMAFSYDQFKTFIHEKIRGLQHLLTMHKTFELRANVFRVIIIGRPNVGKSSIFNKLINEDRAIVDKSPGTTRDYIESRVFVEDLEFSLIDTAGIRLKPVSSVESQGIDKALGLIDDSTIVIEVFDKDGHVPIRNGSILVRNKLDLIKECNFNKDYVYVSALNGEGIRDLLSIISSKLGKINKEAKNEQESIYINYRQKDLIIKLLDVFKQVGAELDKKSGIDVLSLYIKRCIAIIDEISGEEAGTDIIDSVFSRFCIGK